MTTPSAAAVANLQHTLEAMRLDHETTDAYTPLMPDGKPVNDTYVIFRMDELLARPELTPEAKQLAQLCHTNDLETLRIGLQFKPRRHESCWYWYG